MAYDKPDSNVANFNFIESEYVAPQATAADFNFASVVRSYYILAGTSNHFTSVWAYNGKMYVASSDAFSVVNLSTGALIDCYTQNNGGANSEPLIGDNIIDINANM